MLAKLLFDVSALLSAVTSIVTTQDMRRVCTAHRLLHVLACCLRRAAVLLLAAAPANTAGVLLLLHCGADHSILHVLRLDLRC
jgi:heme/copper-type cytochrome/quinol oxidase subunit 1